LLALSAAIRASEPHHPLCPWRPYDGGIACECAAIRAARSEPTADELVEALPCSNCGHDFELHAHNTYSPPHPPVYHCSQGDGCTWFSLDCAAVEIARGQRYIDATRQQQGEGVAGMERQPLLGFDVPRHQPASRPSPTILAVLKPEAP